MVPITYILEQTCLRLQGRFLEMRRKEYLNERLKQMRHVAWILKTYFFNDLTKVKSISYLKNIISNICRKISNTNTIRLGTNMFEISMVVS